VRDPVLAEPAELCDANAACAEADFDDATALDSFLVFLVVDVTARPVEVESAVTTESAFAAGAGSPVFAQEQSRSAAGKKTVRCMQSCV
jgi:hypothetical protein